ncbi:MAG TPA: glycoside hydrolase family 3 N-terminal domain-containing protein [Pyrinomonadaceae bacterium]|nr:glycoside hydrolase family 3 N-terminal domain-containing protein [Pyrinomonadaceae bacterium]
MRALRVEMVKGLQENFTVASTGKHFAVYSVGKGAREGEARTDSQTSPREIENILLPPFKAAIAAALKISKIIIQVNQENACG